MSRSIEEAAVIRTVTAADDSGTHLASLDERSTLCGLRVHAEPLRRFHLDGCIACAQHALATGLQLARDGQGLVNVARFVVRQQGQPPP